MTNRTDARTSPSVAVDCPWCGQPIEMALDAPVLRCGACATEVALAEESGEPEVTLRSEERAAA